MHSYVHDGMTFEVTDTGPPNAPIVIALHGFPEDRNCWSPIAQRLSSAGLRVLAPDQRGYSPGARPAGRSAYRIDHLVGDVIALADEAGSETFDVVGHDWGAVVAWHLASGHPDRIRTLTALSVPHPRAFADALVRSSQLLHSWYMAAFQVPGVPEWLMARRDGTTLRTRLVASGLDEESAARYAARARTPGAMTGPVNWYRALPLGARYRPGPVSTPTLFMWGTEDRFVTRAAAERCALHVKGPFRFDELGGTSHWLPTTVPDAVASAIVEHVSS